MQLISKYNKGFRFLLCVIDFCKYAWVFHLKDENVISVANAFTRFLNKSKRTTKWVDKGSGVSNSSN